MNVKEQLFRELEQVPEPVVAEILDFCLFLKQRHQQQQQSATIPMNHPAHDEATTNMTDFLAQLQNIQTQVPEEEWNQLPHDGSINHDHYLYGAPKVEE